MAVNSIHLRRRRDRLNKSNAGVADEIGRSPRYVENIMCGADQPSPRVIFLLADVLQTEPEVIDPDIYAGKRTPRGDPSEPPQQPPNEPTRPPKRQDKEGDKKGPKRADGRQAVAS